MSKPGLCEEKDIAEFDAILQKTQKLRNSAILEITLLVLAFFPVFLFWPEWGAGSVSSWHTRAGSLTAAGWWFMLFSTPLMRFIDYRWAYRYFIWGYLLWKISHLRLVLMPTHPDHAAGLNFLSMAQKRFGILFCATGCVFAGGVANRIVFDGQPVASFKFLVGGFLVLSVVMGLLPLLMLGPTLTKVRRAGFSSMEGWRTPTLRRSIKSGSTMPSPRRSRCWEPETFSLSRIWETASHSLKA